MYLSVSSTKYIYAYIVFVLSIIGQWPNITYRIYNWRGWTWLYFIFDFFSMISHLFVEAIDQNLVDSKIDFKKKIFNE